LNLVDLGGKFGEAQLGQPARLFELPCFIRGGIVARPTCPRDRPGYLVGKLPVDRAALRRDDALKLAEQRDIPQRPCKFQGIDVVHKPSLTPGFVARALLRKRLASRSSSVLGANPAGPRSSPNQFPS
jgi:hypothetical protein